MNLSSEFLHTANQSRHLFTSTQFIIVIVYSEEAVVLCLIPPSHRNVIVYSEEAVVLCRIPPSNRNAIVYSEDCKNGKDVVKFRTCSKFTWWERSGQRAWYGPNGNVVRTGLTEYQPSRNGIDVVPTS